MKRQAEEWKKCKINHKNYVSRIYKELSQLSINKKIWTGHQRRHTKGKSV